MCGNLPVSWGLGRALRLALSRWYLIGTLTGLRRSVGMVAGVGERDAAERLEAQGCQRFGISLSVTNRDASARPGAG